MPIKYTTINPDTRPSIVFWTSASELPGNDTLDFCAQNDIGFAVVLKESYISDGGASEYADIKRALDRNVDIYVALGGSSDFYLTLNNADEFVDIFKAIRDWMNDNDIYDDKHFIAFLVDAESPTELIKDLSDYQFTDKAQYFINEISDENEKEVEAQESLSKLVELIHDDNKEIGIIKMLNSGDEFDSDNDYSLLLKDVYSLDIDWDFSVSMIYRTQPLPDIFDYMIEDLSKYEYSSDNELTYTDKSDVERYLIPTSTFYYKVAYEVSSTEVNVPKDSRYIFAGTFNKKFEDTSYITGKEYLDDIDICSHFGVDKVFLYDYSGFIARYSKAELQELVDHIKTEKSWHLNVPAYYLQKEVLYTVFAASFDRILYI